jgi:hypothetical protein
VYEPVSCYDWSALIEKRNARQAVPEAAGTVIDSASGAAEKACQPLRPNDTIEGRIPKFSFCVFRKCYETG